MQLIVDIVEPQDDILFVTGYIAKLLSVDDTLNTLSVYEPAKKRKQAPKCLSSVAVSLMIVSIIVDGEPLDTIASDKTAQVGLTGDADAILNLLKNHNWHERNGRYHLPRNETRFIMLSGD